MYWEGGEPSGTSKSVYSCISQPPEMLIEMLEKTEYPYISHIPDTMMVYSLKQKAEFDL